MGSLGTGPAAAGVSRRARMALRRLCNALHPDVTIAPAPAGVIAEWDVPVAVRDGTILRVNVFRPDADQPVPVVLSAHPYGKDGIPARRGVNGQYRAFPQPHPIRFSAWTGWEAPDPATWVARGYAVINADLRGAGTSGGVGELFSGQEHLDYHDLIEWAGTQKWSSGRVGLLGVSYLAISQYGAAATHPPHLAAICPWEGFSDLYRDLAYPGGVREDGFTVMWSVLTDRMTRMTQKLRPQLVARPERDDWYDAHTPVLERIEVPMLLCGSFSDHNLHTRGSFEAFRRAASRQRWLYTHRDGKWTHFYSPDAVAAQGAFFDHFLKGANNGWDRTAPVRVAIHDEGPDPVAVVGEPDWPPPDLDWTTLYVDPRGGALSEEPVAVPGQSSFDLRSGVLTMTWRAPRDCDVIGHGALRLWVGLEGTDDAHLFVGLRKFRGERECVFEGSYGFGFDMVTRGWQRVAHRELDPELSSPWQPVHTHRRAEPVTPDEIVAVDIALRPHATRLRAGDVLRLDIRGTWHFPRNPLTGQFPAGYRRSPAGRCVIHAGGRFDSGLLLGMRESRDGPTWQV
ncbi:CocE/NonD family hydrolase [Mycolicibacterium sp.]|uniref:CocE/NonD family hydrolase n=1 Tax=Mycolicibacterium sp. TaxID=2320850 RepID=UPI0025E26121|nr:CocE/NonD family hydrolase [Mycolicibacterium sp.]MCB9409443.1 CocE/NonD family hydrolase [Mycolicibacterium sp.]